MSKCQWQNETEDNIPTSRLTNKREKEWRGYIIIVLDVLMAFDAARVHGREGRGSDRL